MSAHLNDFLKKSPLVRKFIFYIIFTSTLISILTTGYQLLQIYDKGVSGIETRLAEIEESYQSNLASRVWMSNLEELDLTVNGILKISDIVRVEIYEGDNLLLKAGIYPTVKTIKSEFFLTYRFQNTQRVIGKAHIIASLERTYDNLLDQVLVILITNLFKTFFVAIVILFLFYHFVGKRLIAFQSFTERLHIDSLDNQIDPNFFRVQNRMNLTILLLPC